MSERIRKPRSDSKLYQLPKEVLEQLNDMLLNENMKYSDIQHWLFTEQFADLITGSTNINKGTCELMVAPDLADYPNQWYLLCTTRQIKPLVFQEREKGKLICKNKETDDNVFFDDEVIYGVKARYNVGFGLWRLYKISI